MKIAVVTGGRRGIGFAVARALGLEGYFVLLSAVSAEAGEALAALRGENIACEYRACDISLAEDRDALFAYIKSKYGRLDILVNNAGITHREDILETSEENFRRVTETNLLGTFFMCQQAAKLMIETRGGPEEYAPRIVNITSISAYTSSVTRGAYCVSKAGLSMVTRLFADRLAAYGIPVFEIRPGFIQTDMTKPVQVKYEKMIAEGLTPIPRMGTPADVAACVLAACGGLLDFATGQVLDADGGFHIRRV